MPTCSERYLNNNSNYLKNMNVTSGIFDCIVSLAFPEHRIERQETKSRIHFTI